MENLINGISPIPPVSDPVEAYYQTVVRHSGQKFKEFHWSSIHLLFNLFYTHELVEASLAKSLSTHGLSLSALNVLTILSRSETKGRHLHQLSELLVVSRSNITGLIDCLEKRGLVERVEVKPDRRRRIARITETGDKLLASILPEHYTEVREMLSGISDEEKATLAELLAKVRRCVQQQTGEDRTEMKEDCSNGDMAAPE